MFRQDLVLGEVKHIYLKERISLADIQIIFLLKTDILTYCDLTAESQNSGTNIYSHCWATVR
jgi:glycerol-3-phosphate responsive antiterminator